MACKKTTQLARRLHGDLVAFQDAVAQDESKQSGPLVEALIAALQQDFGFKAEPGETVDQQFDIQKRKVAELKGVVTRKEDTESGAVIQFGECVCLVAIVIAAAAPFCGSLRGDLVLDDVAAVRDNPDVWPDGNGKQRGSVWGGEDSLWHNNFWGDSMSSPIARHHSFRPLVIITYRLQLALAGAVPSMEQVCLALHTANVTCHVFNCLLLFEICRNVLSFDRCSGSFVALLFGVHAIHAEAVAGIVGRCELMAAFFLLLGFRCYVFCNTRAHAAGAAAAKVRKDMSAKAPKGKIKAQPGELRASAASGRQSLMWSIFGFLVLWALAWCAILCKETGIAVYALCVAYDVVVCLHGEGEESSGDARLQTLLWRVLVVGAAAAATLAQRFSWNKGGDVTFDWASNPALHASTPRFESWATVLYYATLHFWKLLWPEVLACDYSGPSIPLLHWEFDIRHLATLTFLGAPLS
eukprot:TRINITY_DN19825_c0_g1_i1.p1 TRINITY_DN19825_c0_g1~~TRINITY_DN19825_c0_g1_i1.p1  ORF type:complete len:485 (+),score=78.56 TRINITY_DN19825_c0_g1_i1:54-1457(+)